MGKVADRYLVVEPWRLVEEGFHPDRGRASESLFSLANEHLGIRGYFDEGYSGDRLVGSYLSGVHEEHVLAEPLAYRGISDRICFVANTVDWLYTRIELGGETLDLATAAFSDFRRELDFQTGELRRSFTWQTRLGHRLRLEFRRLLSMATPELALQRIALTALDFDGPVTLTLGLDFSPRHETYDRNLWGTPRQATFEDGAAILGVGESIGHVVFAGFALDPTVAGHGDGFETERLVGRRFDIELKQDAERLIDRRAVVRSPRQPRADVEDAWRQGLASLEAARSIRYEAVLEANAAEWRTFWDRSDIVIEGDPEAQQGIRFCLFQLHQTYRGVVPGSNIGAKGLSGEAYNGNAFWDTETYCLPFYLFSDTPAAKALLDFRFRTLPQALDRARALDCRGACYPIATCDGTESCTLWQHASLQLQPTTAVAYAIRHYVRVSGDREFLYGEGAEMLVQICRFLASRGQWSPRRGRFGFYAVMGPDEFQLMVNNNAYTNYMARRTFLSTLEALAEFEAAAPARAKALLERLSCSPGELAEWRRMAEAMYVPHDPATGLYEQHEGFFDLPHVDVDAIPVEDFPLYDHWSYDRIYRNDMIKQPDVLMFMLLYNQSFSAAEKRANYEYYEPRCIHESSLSPSVHSILAAELDRPQEAFDFFRFATRIDLDDYNRNVREGVHMTSIAAAWMNIVYGFGGLRSDGETLVFRPTIPAHWRSYAFQIACRGSLVRVSVDQEAALLRVVAGGPVEAIVAGRIQTIDSAGLRVTIGGDAA